MATSKLSDMMITTLLDALTHRTGSGLYRVSANVRTRNALVNRGKVERWEASHRAANVPPFVLTAEGLTYLREALAYVLGQRGEDRDAVWVQWLTADRRHEWAVIDFLGLTADTYEVVTTTPQERGQHRETLGRADAWERMSNAFRNGQRITLDDGAMTVHTKLGAAWTFKPQRPAAPVEDPAAKIKAAEEPPAPRMVAACCSCGAGIEMPMDGPRPACTHNGETRPNGGVVVAGKVVRQAERGTCYTDRHHITGVPRWESGNYVPRCAECVAADLGVSVEALPGYESVPAEDGLTLVIEGASEWPPAEVAPAARKHLDMDAPGYMISGEEPPAPEGKATRRDKGQALSLLAGRMCLAGAVVHADGAGTVRITQSDGRRVWLRPVGSPAAEAREKGMPAGPHRITNTGEDAEGGIAYAFECHRCEKHATYADFQYGRAGKCTDQAEADHAHGRARNLLADTTFKGATAYAITSPNEFGTPVTRNADRAEALMVLTYWMRCGAPHTWGRGELRVRCHQSTHTVRPVIEESADRAPLLLTREPWRGGQICGHQTVYGMGAFSERYCGERKAPGLVECAEHNDDTMSNYGPRAVRQAIAAGVAVGDPAAPLVLLWEPYEGTEPVEPTEEERAAFEAAQAQAAPALPFRVAVRGTTARVFDPADDRVTRCERCGDSGFLARDWDDTQVPALCIACHDSSATRQADDGHQCEDWCGLGTDHDGLCAPGDADDDEAAPGTMAGLPDADAQRATNAAIAAHFQREAAELLGDGDQWMRHFHGFGQTPRVERVDRAAALELVVMCLRHGGWQVYRADAGGLNLESPNGESSYWLEPQEAEALPEGPEFEHAVKTARAAVPIMQRVVKPEFWCGHVIVSKGDRFAVYRESAWERPSTPGLLPWSAPTGTPVALVALDGTVTAIGSEKAAALVRDDEPTPLEEMGTDELLTVLREEAASLPADGRFARAWAAMDEILTNGGIECLPAPWDGYADQGADADR